MSNLTQLTNSTVLKQENTDRRFAFPAVSASIFTPGALSEIRVPVGTILAYGADLLPSKYLLCDGSAIQRDQFSKLFDAIGETWGEGDGSTTFNIPDLRGEFLRGQSIGSGNDPDVGSRTAKFTGGAISNNVGSYQLGEIESHIHQVARNFDSESFGGGIRGVLGGQNIETTASGGNETRSRNAAVKFIIKF